MNVVRIRSHGVSAETRSTEVLLSLTRPRYILRVEASWTSHGVRFLVVLVVDDDVVVGLRGE